MIEIFLNKFSHHQFSIFVQESNDKSITFSDVQMSYNLKDSEKAIKKLVLLEMKRHKKGF